MATRQDGAVPCRLAGIAATTTGSHGLTWLAPPILRWHDRQGPAQFVPPALLAVSRHPRGRHHHPHRPTTQRIDPAGSTYAVLPLLVLPRAGQGRDRTRLAPALLPPAILRRAPDRGRHLPDSGPLAALRRRRAKAGGFSPSSSSPARSAQPPGRGPVLWSFATGVEHHPGFPALVSRKRRQQFAHRHPPPALTFTGHDHEASSISVPLLWHFADFPPRHVHHRGSPLLPRRGSTGSSAGMCRFCSGAAA